MASQTLPEIISTNPPPALAHPRGSNASAIGDSIGAEDSQPIRRLSMDVEKTGAHSDCVEGREMYLPPTQEEALSLRKISDTIPRVTWLLCLVEFAERASYYGAKGVFSNFMQFPLPAGGNGAGAPLRGSEKTAGALGRGIGFSVPLGLVFTFLAYTVPILGAWIADVKLGRIKVIMIGIIIGGIAHIIQICGAIPSVLQAGNGTAPFLTSLILLALGAGLFKPNVSPLILDQYRHQKPYVKQLPSGERCIVDPESTIQRIMLWFYLFVNLGAFYRIATTYSEKYIDFWLAFLTPGILYFILPIVVLYLWNKLLKLPPGGSPLVKFCKITATAVKNSKGRLWKNDFWDGAKPRNLDTTTVPWSDRDVSDTYRTLTACSIFLYFPIYAINDGGIGSVGTSQAAAMTTKGVPNDLIDNFNPITIIVTVPLLSHVVYPALRARKIRFGPVKRMTTGFCFAMASGIAGAVLQYHIYQTSPCGYSASDCDIGDGVSPISVWWQAIGYGMGGISECLCNVTAYEVAYARSPQGMKSLVISIFLFMNALSSALSLIIAPAINDPNLVWVWAAPVVALATQTIIFWFRYRRLDDEDYMLEEKAADAASARDSSSEREGSTSLHDKDVHEQKQETKS